jgi:hypothetical protein
MWSWEESGGMKYLHTSGLPSGLLRAVGADLKVMQELLRHSKIRVTLDTYTQAVTAAKRTAHTAVVSLIVGNGE